MQGHGLDNRIGQAPETEKIRSNLSVGRTDALLFAFPERETLSAGQFDCLGHFVWTFLDQHPIPDIVQQSRKPRIIR